MTVHKKYDLDKAIIDNLRWYSALKSQRPSKRKASNRHGKRSKNKHSVPIG